MNVTITKVDEQLYSGQTKSVNVPGIDGEMTVLPHHTALVTILKKGEIRLVDSAGNNEKFSIEKGLLEVANNSVTILL
jgi:F-type H+-transporting ATPase subunit epsilon